MALMQSMDLLVSMASLLSLFLASLDAFTWLPYIRISALVDLVTRL